MGPIVAVVVHARRGIALSGPQTDVPSAIPTPGLTLDRQVRACTSEAHQVFGLSAR